VLTENTVGVTDASTFDRDGAALPVLKTQSSLLWAVLASALGGSL